MAGAEQSKLKEYLLDQLTEDEEEQVEVRLLSDPDFVEEHDIVVDELVYDYVAGRLGGEDVQRMKDVFFQSSGREDKLKFALALKQYKFDLDVKLHRQRLFKRYGAIAASLLLVVGSLYIWRLRFSDDGLNKGMAALQAAFRDERPFEARLSNFPYAPLITQRGGSSKIDYVQRDRAASFLRHAVSERPNAATHHALGQYYLAERQFDKAIDELKRALDLDPNNAKIYSDLGVAWFEQAKLDRKSDPDKGTAELARSLENLNKAVALNPTLPEAIFNRALYHEYLMQPAAAGEDWRRYLQLDSGSPWTAEAKQFLTTLEQRTSPRPPEP